METDCSEGSEEISLDYTITKSIFMHLAFLVVPLPCFVHFLIIRPDKSVRQLPPPRNG